MQRFNNVLIVSVKCLMKQFRYMALGVGCLFGFCVCVCVCVGFFVCLFVFVVVVELAKVL